MQFKLASLATVAIATLAVATPTPRDVCSTGTVQCCNSVQAASSTGVAALLGLLGIVVQDVTALVGVNCTPISVIGIGGNSCTAQTVCCKDNSF
ncbi:fungal hydrophobin-domain-containing protein, partial [Crucibulum laeve]